MPHFAGPATTAFFLILLQLQEIRSQEPILQYERREPNIIVMGCIEASTDMLREEAVFYRSNEVFYEFGQPVDNGVVETIIPQNNNREIAFVIDRFSEGSYHCQFSTLGARSRAEDITG